jgi:sirohydrochlorin ferrochelatase
MERLLPKKVKFQTKPDYKFLSIFIIPILVEMLSRKRTAQLEELSAPKHAISAALLPAGASPPGGSARANKKSTRREELLKQLKAVEDAFKRKRSKISS